MKTPLNRNGLSGIEVLIAIILVAIIASFAFPTISRSHTRIKVGYTMQLIGQVSMLLEMYHTDYKRYPDTLQSLEVLGINPDDIPTDPFNPTGGFFQYYTNDYSYKGSVYTADQLWILSSFGPDKDGDVADGNSIVGKTGVYDSAFDAIVLEAMAGGKSISNYLKTLDTTQQHNYKKGDLMRTGPIDIRILKYIEIEGEWFSIAGSDA